MAPKHRYSLASSPGRIPTTAGAISLTLGMVLAAVFGRADALVNGFGGFELLDALAPRGEALRVGAVAGLVAYPALYAANTLFETWTYNRFAAWLGRRLRGSFCLLWSALASAILAVHVAHGRPGMVAAIGSAIVFAVGGITVRWLSRQRTPSFQPLARTAPAFLVAFAAAGVTVVQLQLGTHVSMLDSLLASGVGVGATLLLIGGLRDVIHQLRHTPRTLFDREGVQRALRLQ